MAIRCYLSSILIFLTGKQMLHGKHSLITRLLTKELNVNSPKLFLRSLKTRYPQYKRKMMKSTRVSKINIPTLLAILITLLWDYGTKQALLNLLSITSLQIKKKCLKPQILPINNIKSPFHSLLGYQPSIFYTDQRYCTN